MNGFSNNSKSREKLILSAKTQKSNALSPSLRNNNNKNNNVHHHHDSGRHSSQPKVPELSPRRLQFLMVRSMGFLGLILFCTFWLWHVPSVFDMHQSSMIPSILIDLPILTSAVFEFDNDATGAHREAHNTFGTRGLSYQQQSCFSPEKSVAWPYSFDFCPEAYEAKNSKHGSNHYYQPTLVGQSRTSPLSCGVCDQTPLTKYFRKLSQVTRDLLQDKCDTLVYSVQFGKLTKKLGSRFNLTLDQHVNMDSNCTLVFMLKEDLSHRVMSGEMKPFAPGTERYLLRSNKEKWALRVPLPRNLLPYENMRRNVKLIKMHGFQMFDWHQRLVWIDGKFRHELHPRAFEQYVQDTVLRNDACAAFVAMPTDLATMGPDYQRYTKPTYKGHCQTILTTIAKRPSVTDSSPAVWKQCEGYLRETEAKADQTHRMNLLHHFAGATQQRMNAADMAAGNSPFLFKQTDTTNLAVLSSSISPLDDYLIDSAAIVWNTQPARCKQFLADLSCTWADQIRCFADRDQVSFPYVLDSMNLTKVSGDGVEENLIFANAKHQNMVEIVKTQCHWYAGPTFDCVRNATIAAEQREAARRAVAHKQQPSFEEEDEETDTTSSVGSRSSGGSGGGDRIRQVLAELMDAHGEGALKNAIALLLQGSSNNVGIESEDVSQQMQQTPYTSEGEGGMATTTATTLTSNAHLLQQQELPFVRTRIRNAQDDTRAVITALLAGQQGHVTMGGRTIEGGGGGITTGARGMEGAIRGVTGARGVAVGRRKTRKMRQK